MESLFLPHLNVQTNSNLSFSFLTIPQLVDWAYQNKLNYLAIADYYPYDLVDFFKLCKEKKIKPIWGVKIFLRTESENQKYSATVYPHNSKGYKEVLQLLFSPTAPTERVFPFQQTLVNLSQNCSIVLETHRLEEINYLAAKWKNFTSLSTVKVDNLLLSFDFYLFSPRQSLPASIIPFLLPFFSIKSLSGKEIELLKLWKRTSFSRSFFPADTQVNFFSYLPAKELFAECTNDPIFYQSLLVKWQTFLTKINLGFPLKQEKESKVQKEKNSLLALELENKCWQKLLTLKKKTEVGYQTVLEKELAVIKKFNYADYFLIFSEVVDYLKTKNIIIGPGRGSAVSSLVVYLLGITSIDPLQHNLIFERFLNEKRETLPDIDLDVENQEEVFNYLQQKYPKNQVARILVKKRIGWKNALQKSLSVCREVKGQEVNEKSLYREITYLTEKELNLNHPRLKKMIFNYPLTFALAVKIKDLYYATGVHPSGVAIATKRSLSQLLIPVKKDENFLFSFYEESKLALLGLKKYDFLSLAESLALPSLDFIKEVKDILKIKLPDYQEINLHDEKTRQLLGNFLLAGVFQLDTPIARQLFLVFRPKTLSELTVFLALNRPGMRGKIAKEIIQKKNRHEKVPLVTPKLKQILDESYGFIIFEEQISQILALVYDCSFAEAEIKRRELSEKPLRKDFLTKREKLTFSERQLIYQQINSIRGYTFNKAHAVAYSYLTYYLAYLKANFFSELITYFLNKNKEKTLTYCQEAFFYGFQIEGPDINYSEIEWSKQGRKIIMGFSHLKEYQSEFFQSLIKERVRGGPFSNWENLFNRTLFHWKNLKITAFEEWIKSNLFRSLQVEAEILLANKENLFRYFQIRQKIQAINNSSKTKPNQENHSFIQVSYKSLPFLDLSSQNIPVDKLTINRHEWESLGLYVSYFSRWKMFAQKAEFRIDCLLNIYSRIEEYGSDQEISINLYAIVSKLEKKEANNCILWLQDVRSSFKLAITEPIYQINQEKLVIHNELLFSLKIILKEGRIFSLICERIESL
ncbi:MAG: PHP domain-containing protein [Candidatus Moeniiplasma glomeromycotorum]|nr:PHP domain-containing protein [Candidatus Moeniiplasma glomeromycotorum]MCE8167226.1 PHP domain-containing protein [Candidatus Moeniiplasma glomeromycotorum]MCE8168761.1 PHP domain-containing protein [Candidatus Moeniiplasma glomeromycotorum]